MQSVRRLPLLALFGAAIFALIPACSRDPGYSQASPEATIATAQQMVRKGEAKLLVKLIYSDDEGMRRCLNRLGHTLGHLQDLAVALNRAFPEEARKLKEEAKSQTAKGGARGLFQVFAGASRSGQQRQPPGSDQFNAQLTRIFTAPYQVLEEEGANFSALKLDDKTYSLLYRDGPIVPGIPILLKLDERDKRWYFVLPLDLPIFAGYFFRSKEAWQTYTGLVATLDNIVIDLTQDVKDGKLKSLNDTARVAGEKAFTSLPFAIIALDRLTAAERKKSGVGAPVVPVPGPR